MSGEKFRCVVKKHIVDITKYQPHKVPDTDIPDKVAGDLRKPRLTVEPGGRAPSSG